VQWPVSKDWDLETYLKQLAERHSIYFVLLD